MASRMGAVLSSILDIVLPRRARSVLLETCRTEDIPLLIETHAHAGRSITSLMSYAEPIVESLIRGLKYDHSTRAAELLAQVLTDYLIEEFSDSARFIARKTLIIPIPLHPVRERERGFNQVSLVLSKLPPEFQAHVRTDILARTRNTKPQTKLKRAERLINMRGAFAVLRHQELMGMHVIVLDDVTTTGATLYEVTCVLTENGADITALALSRAN